jgi:predicted NUDIX family phosphoesterase
VAADENVLAVATTTFRALGVFQGFSSRIEDYRPIFDPANLLFRPRSQVETDPTFKQIIPYVVLRFQNLVFHYVRGKRGAESRLRALRSIGIGGHIEQCDQNLFGDTYRQGMLREIQEEVSLDGPYTESCIGLINDDSTPVGQVHLGIVHVLKLTQPKVAPRDRAITKVGFATIEDLRKHADEFESWSHHVLAALD